MLFSKTKFDINRLKSNSFIAYTHLGLGDHIICNGLLNYFSNNYKSIFLPVKSRDLDNVTYLYQDNPKIKIFKIEHESEKDDIKNFSKKNNLEILKVGFEMRKPPFNLSFYTQFNLDYQISLDYFHIPKNSKKEKELLEHLISYYKINKNYQLVHNQSSYGKVDLKINKSLPTIYVDKESDLYKNMFLYTDVIKNAREIHCLDSSFLHLVERVETKADLYFHKIKKENQQSAQVHLIKNWQEINYIK